MHISNGTKHIRRFLVIILMCFLFIYLNQTVFAKTEYTNQTVIVQKNNTKLYKKPHSSSRVMCVLYKKMKFKPIKSHGKYIQISVPNIGKYWVQKNRVVIQSAKFALSKKDRAKQKKQIKKGKVIAREMEKDKLRKAIINEAKKYVGILPYVYGGSDLQYGSDCSGFTSAIYRKFNIHIPRSSDMQTWSGKHVSMKNIKVGDIVCYPNHVAIYIGHNHIVHATVPGQYVTISHINVISPIVRIVRYI